jgi:hypothetical protein
MEAANRKAAIEKYGYDPVPYPSPSEQTYQNPSGQGLIRSLENIFGDKETASRALAGIMNGRIAGDIPSSVLRAEEATAGKSDAIHGIPGIKYLDQGSRGAGEGSRNYVVFDDKLVSILKKYGIPAAVMPKVMEELMSEQDRNSGGRIKLPTALNTAYSIRRAMQ